MVFASGRSMQRERDSACSIAACVSFIQETTAVIYGAAGAVGSTIAKAFAREGATAHLPGRKQGRLDAIASEIGAARGTAKVAEVDALDEAAIERHLDAVGRIDIAFNAQPHGRQEPRLTSASRARCRSAAYPERADLSGFFWRRHGRAHAYGTDNLFEGRRRVPLHPRTRAREHLVTEFEQGTYTGSATKCGGLITPGCASSSSETRFW
jgi:short chain dehydrogenase